MNRPVLLIAFAIAVAACDPGASQPASVEGQIDPAAAARFKDDFDPKMPPLQKWDGQPLPRAQSQDAEIFVFRSDNDPGAALAAEVDCDKVIDFVLLPWDAVGMFVDTNVPADLKDPPFKIEVDVLNRCPPPEKAAAFRTYAIKPCPGPPPKAAVLIDRANRHADDDAL